MISVLVVDYARHRRDRPQPDLADLLGHRGGGAASGTFPVWVGPDQGGLEIGRRSLVPRGRRGLAIFPFGLFEGGTGGYGGVSDTEQKGGGGFGNALGGGGREGGGRISERGCRHVPRSPYGGVAPYSGGGAPIAGH